MMHRSKDNGLAIIHSIAAMKNLIEMSDRYQGESVAGTGMQQDQDIRQTFMARTGAEQSLLTSVVHGEVQIDLI